MADPEDTLRRAFISYDEIPEPSPLPSVGGSGGVTHSEDPARNVSEFPDLYLSMRLRAEQAVSSAWGWFTRGGNVT